MNKYVLVSISTLAGAVAGFFAGKFYYDKKYSKRADEEVESVKQSLGFYDVKETEDTAEKQPDKKPQVVTNSLDVAELKKYQQSVDNLKYATASTSSNSTEPYVIQAERYGDKDDYETVTLNYYSEDGVVTYDNDDALSKADIHRMIGDHFADAFEKTHYTVYVRNDVLACDYEILLIMGSYEDVLTEHPYLRKDNTDDDD